MHKILAFVQQNFAFIQSVLNDTSQFNRNIFKMVDDVVAARDKKSALFILEHFTPHDRYYEYTLNAIFWFLSTDDPELMKKYFIRFQDFNHLGEYFLLKNNPEQRKFEHCQDIVSTARIDALRLMMTIDNKAVQEAVRTKLLLPVDPNVGCGSIYRRVEGQNFVSLSEFGIQSCINFYSLQSQTMGHFFVSSRYTINDDLRKLKQQFTDSSLKRGGLIFKEDHTFYVQIEKTQNGEYHAFFLSSCGHYKEPRYDKMEGWLNEHFSDIRCHRFRDSTQRIIVGCTVHAVAFFSVCHTIDLTKLVSSDGANPIHLKFPKVLEQFSEKKQEIEECPIMIKGKAYPKSLVQLHAKFNTIAIESTTELYRNVPKHSKLPPQRV